MEKLNELLTQQTREQLIELIDFCASRRPELESELMLQMGYLDEKEEVLRLKEIIQEAIYDNRRGGFVSWSACDRITDEFDEVLSHCETLGNKKYYEAAFLGTLLVVEKSVYLAEIADSSSGSLSFTMDEGMTLLGKLAGQIASNGTEEQQKLLFTKAMNTSKKKLFEGWESEAFRLLVAVLPLVNQKNRKKFVTIYEKIFAESASDYGYLKSYRLKLSVQLYLHFSEEEEALRVMDSNLTDSEIYRLRMDYALKNKDYVVAEKMAINKIKNNPRMNFHYLKEWYEDLVMIYTETHSDEKLLEVYHQMVLKGDFNAYKTYKQLLIERKQWNNVYPELLIELENKLSRYEYAIILANEGELDKLFVVVSKEKSMLEPEYGSLLFPKYPGEVTSLFKELVFENLAAAKDRRTYQQVTRLISQYSRYGYKPQALSWIEEIISANRNRPALIDEMEKVAYYIRH